MASIARIFLVTIALITLAGCGTTVPEIQEFWGTPEDASNRVNNIVYQVKCELGHAVSDAIGKDRYYAKHNGKRFLKFMENWTAELVLLLVVDEKTAINPSFSNISPISPIVSMQNFTIGLGIGASSEATRTDKLNLFYPVKDLLVEYPFDFDHPFPPCPLRQGHGMVFLTSDLKIYEWMSQEVTPQYLEDSAPFAKLAKKSLAAAYTHDIKFEIVNSGTANPSWKLTRVTADTGSNPLFGESRDRQQELILTMGPSDGTGAEKATVTKDSTFSTMIAAETASKTNLGH